jgi:hypothetical protein
VSKSIYAVGGIGAAGCLLLMFMMQHLVQVRQDQSSSPIAKELQEAFGNYLTGPVRVQAANQGGAATLTVRMVAKPGVQREKLVASADSLLWRQIAQWKEPPQVVHFEVEDELGAPTVIMDLKPPRFLQSGTSPSKSAPGNPASAPPQQR